MSVNHGMGGTDGLDRVEQHGTIRPNWHTGLQHSENGAPTRTGMGRAGGVPNQVSENMN